MTKNISNAVSLKSHFVSNTIKIKTIRYKTAEDEDEQNEKLLLCLNIMLNENETNSKLSSASNLNCLFQSNA